MYLKDEQSPCMIHIMQIRQMSVVASWLAACQKILTQTLVQNRPLTKKNKYIDSKENRQSDRCIQVYTECIFNSIEGMPGINISGNIVNNLRYADDTVLIADNEQDLQNIVDTIHRQSKEFGLDMNVKKTKTMVISCKAEIPRVSITVNNILEQVKEFTYLGQNI